jgi:hypothetical protein
MFNCIAMANDLLIQDLKRGIVRIRECYTTSKSANKQDHLVVKEVLMIGRFYMCRISIVPMIFEIERSNI